MKVKTIFGEIVWRILSISHLIRLYVNAYYLPALESEMLSILTLSTFESV